MPKKDNKKDKKEKRTINKNDSETIDIEVVPSGVKKKVSEMGMTVFSKKGALNMSLQWGEDGDWETIRVIQTDSTYALPMTSVVREGDAVKKFRLLVENENNEDLDYFYWVDSTILALF